MLGSLSTDVPWQVWSSDADQSVLRTLVHEGLMAGICITSVSPSSCGHRQLTYTLDGETIAFDFDEYQTAVPLTTEEKITLLKLGTRALRARDGTTLAQLLARVVHGEEATNVKVYDFFGPGAAITKSAIGTAYVNICPGVNGEKILVDGTGCTQFRLMMTANLAGSGPFGLRVVRDGDSSVLYEASSIAQTGERELDTGWQTLPEWVVGQEQMRVQAKSTTAADSPLFRRCSILVR